MKEILSSFVVLVLTISCASEAEKPISNPQKERLSVLATMKELEIGAMEKSLIAQGLVDIQKESPLILVDLKYSTKDNFFGKDVYGELEKAFLPKFVAAKLGVASDSLISQSTNLRLMVFDAVRPHSVQQILWDALDSIPVNVRKAYVADPMVGSLHNYGCAIDLSIYDVAKDSLLDMGTKYDYFGYLAYPRKEMEMLAQGLLNKEQIANREILRSVMKQAGFMPITSEWWHFNSTTLLQAKQDFALIN
ncbi:M15 family metallopeptidase [uncultured Arcticibacterium sp.]|uniref:M15 family metallopeptidase n=1 Tax=uncultured Arcticibacterium sp. TaxID=2173042 RepID=UPI0030F4F9C2